MESSASPAVLSAAGLMVPEPSIISFPMPFIDEGAGCDAEYMACDERVDHHDGTVAITIPTTKSRGRG